MNKPPCLAWLPMDHRLLGSSEKQMPFLVLGDKYARAIKEGALAQPVLFLLADASQIPDLLDLALLSACIEQRGPNSVFVLWADAFAYAVQWHPEWRCLETSFYTAIFEAFGNACRARQNDRLNNYEHTLHVAVGSP